MGADDYITKPFSMRELLARVKAHLRRTEIVREGCGRGTRRASPYAPQQEPVLSFGNLTIDENRREVSRSTTSQSK